LFQDNGKSFSEDAMDKRSWVRKVIEVDLPTPTDETLRSFLTQGSSRFEITVSQPLRLGLGALLTLLNTYFVSKRMEIRQSAKS